LFAVQHNTHSDSTNKWTSDANNPAEHDFHSRYFAAEHAHPTLPHAPPQWHPEQAERVTDLIT
jgi:hypothetical protein